MSGESRLSAVLEYASEKAINRKQFVYVIRCDKFVKIGIATDPKSRLDQMQTGSPYNLEMIATFPCDNAVAIEAMIHNRLARWRRRGEWFELPELEVALIGQYLNECVSELSRIEHDKLEFTDPVKLPPKPRVERIKFPPSFSPRIVNEIYRKVRPLKGYYHRDAVRRIEVHPMPRSCKIAGRVDQVPHP